MTGLSGLVFVVVVVASFFSVSANVISYTVTFVACVPGSTCPKGNPTTFNMTFVLNGNLSPNLILYVGDQLQFNLATNVSIHPLTTCQNSSSPQFCQGIATSNELSTPITVAGATASVTFTTGGTYYYGCHNHPGMGAIISVTNVGHQVSALFVLIAIVTLLAIT